MNVLNLSAVCLLLYYLSTCVWCSRYKEYTRILHFAKRHSVHSGKNFEVDKTLATELYVIITEQY